MVEDDRSTASALAMLLNLRGWSVEVAPTVAEALARLDAVFDWAILDLMLPDGDGESVLSTIRDRGLPTRVVITTGISDGPRLIRVRALAPDLLMSKPIDVQALLTRLGPAGRGTGGTGGEGRQQTGDGGRT